MRKSSKERVFDHVGGDSEPTERTGLERVDSVSEALEITQDTASSNTTHMHVPPLFMCEVS